MPKVSSHTRKELYRIEIKSPTGNTIIADEPIEVGGKDLGFSPKELLISALAACTSATLRMYADRKEWDLKEVNVDIEQERDETANKTIIKRKLHLTGNLDETQRARLISVANSCPVHKILTNPIEIETFLE